MSTPNRTSRLGGGTYRRPSADVLDDLTNPGISGTSNYSGTSGTVETIETQDVSETSGAVVTSGTKRNSGTSATQGGSDTRDTSSNSETFDASGTSGNSGTKPAATPRDHVKVSRPLVGEMRDAVWFLSEHGRPRIQLGELLDEAISAWLAAAKIDCNGGAPFPVRGRLR